METAATTSTARPAFHSDDLEPLTEYRTLSSLAIVSLLFGLASPLCFVMPLLMAVPMFGTAISIVALRRISASDGALAGRWAATLGLALCIGSAVAAITYSQATRYLLSQQAEVFAREWLGLLLTGKTDDAFQLTGEGSRPAPPPEPGQPTPAESPRELFASRPFVLALGELGPDSTIRFDGTTSYDAPTSSQVFVVQRFTITPPNSASDGDAKREPFEAVLTVQRSKLPGGAAPRWLVWSHEPPDNSADEATSQ